MVDTMRILGRPAHVIGCSGDTELLGKALDEALDATSGDSRCPIILDEFNCMDAEHMQSVFERATEKNFTCIALSSGSTVADLPHFTQKCIEHDMLLPELTTIVQVLCACSRLACMHLCTRLHVCMAGDADG